MRHVDAWETCDARIFTSESAAADWERSLDLADAATEALRAGKSVADALSGWGVTWPAEDLAILSQLTKDVGLSIPYWQCRDEPGYAACAVTPEMRVRVGGYAGSWSGGYSDNITVRDLLSYARATVARFGKLPPIWEPTAREPRQEKP